MIRLFKYSIEFRSFWRKGPSIKWSLNILSLIFWVSSARWLKKPLPEGKTKICWGNVCKVKLRENDVIWCCLKKQFLISTGQMIRIILLLERFKLPHFQQIWVSIDIKQIIATSYHIYPRKSRFNQQTNIKTSKLSTAITDFKLGHWQIFKKSTTILSLPERCRD